MTDNPRRTGLYDLHGRLGARLVPFAGWEMPVQYPMGVLAEHLHTRARAGLFDVSHMGQVLVTPNDGDMATAALALERLIPADVMGLAEGRQRYGLFTNDRGGILDDLMFANRGDHFLLVVNAALLGLTAALTDRLTVDGFGSALVGGLLLAIGGWVSDQIVDRD